MQDTLRKSPTEGGPRRAETFVFAPYHYHAVYFEADRYLMLSVRSIAQLGEALLHTLGKASPDTDFLQKGRR